MTPFEAAFLNAINPLEHDSSETSAGDQDSNSTFAIDTTGFVLSAYEMDKIEELKAWWEATKLQRRKGTFRLLDLPPEVREHVYRHSFADEAPAEGYDLSNFKYPAITRVCKELRKESLPLFFGGSSFYCKVKSNFEGRRRSSTLLYVLRQHPRNVGVLRIPLKLQASIKEAGSAAKIRDLTLKIYSNQSGMITGDGKDLKAVAYLRMKYIKGQLQISTENGEGHPSNWHQLDGFHNRYRVPSWTTEDVTAMLEEATDEAEDIAGQEGFRGLKLKHIQTIAKKFRFERNN